MKRTILCGLYLGVREWKQATSVDPLTPPSKSVLQRHLLILERRHSRILETTAVYIPPHRSVCISQNVFELIFMHNPLPHEDIKGKENSGNINPY